MRLTWLWDRDTLRDNGVAVLAGVVILASRDQRRQRRNKLTTRSAAPILQRLTALKPREVVVIGGSSAVASTVEDQVLATLR